MPTADVRDVFVQQVGTPEPGLQAPLTGAGEAGPNTASTAAATNAVAAVPVRIRPRFCRDGVRRGGHAATSSIGTA